MKLVIKETLRQRGDVALLVLMVLISVGGMLALPMHLSNIINNLHVVNADESYLLTQGVYMLGWALLSMVGMIFMGYFASRIAVKMGRSLRSIIFASVQNFSPAEIDKFSTASLITRTNNDVMLIQNFMIMVLVVLLMAPVMLIGGVIAAITKSPDMSLVLLLAIPVLVVAIVLIAKKAIPLAESIQGKIDNINLIMREQITGIRVIRAFTTEKHESIRFMDSTDDLMQTSLKMQRAMGLLQPTMMLIINVTIIGILLIGGNSATLVANSGNIVAIIQILELIMFSVVMLCIVLLQYPRAAISAQRVTEIADTKSSINSPENPVSEPQQKGYVEFRNVSFSYPGADRPAIKNISFKANPGELTAIIGSTGSGKTTILNLIPRLYDVSEGEVLVDEVDVRKYDLTMLRNKIGYVLQRALLFRGTIKKNLMFGKEDATEFEMKDAAEIAQSTDFIMKKEKNFDDPISQGGSNVSGGQRQRLSIIRAIIRKPEIYIFDDSFSALDFKTDVNLRTALQKQCKNSALIIVAQRISTIMHAHQILVLEHGEIVGHGTHSELLQNCAPYREIAESQLCSSEVEA